MLNVFAAGKKDGYPYHARYQWFLGERLSDKDLGLVDLVLLDIKAMTPDLHRRLAGRTTSRYTNSPAAWQHRESRCGSVLCSCPVGRTT